ncbi:LysR substrate-binding domain-containing protein [Paraburkholderia acidicola]|uniref:LysR substrate-binding domain-containing protein n=1 Tax=Paraburkholderia acidicola TaxID=1912599 RepID=A0ABV1LRA1_9BURK
MTFSSRIPPLQTLRVFEAAVRLRSFTRAADELALTQGAVSQHVRALESQLDVSLFERTPGGAMPTPHAHDLALQVRQGLRVLERAFGEAAQARAPVHARVRLTMAVLPVFAERWLAPRLPRFHAAHPEIALDIHPAVALAKLDHRDRVDVALRYGPGEWPGLHADKLMDEEIFPVASPHYRGGKLPRRFADLAHCKLLRHKAQPWEPWFQAAGLDMTEPSGAVSFTDGAQLLDAALRGDGIALARRSVIEADLASGRLVQLWKRSVIDVYAYFIVWRPDSTKLPAIDALRAWLHSEAGAVALR